MVTRSSPIIKPGTRTVTLWDAPVLACCPTMATLLGHRRYRYSADSKALVMHYGLDGRPGAYIVHIDYCPHCGAKVRLA